MWVWSLGREDPLEKEMTTHSSIPAWEIPWTEEPGGLQSRGSQRIGHDWKTVHTAMLIKDVKCIKTQLRGWLDGKGTDPDWQLYKDNSSSNQHGWTRVEQVCRCVRLRVNLGGKIRAWSIGWCNSRWALMLQLFKLLLQFCFLKSFY